MIFRNGTDGLIVRSAPGEDANVVKAQNIEIGSLPESLETDRGFFQLDNELDVYRQDLSVLCLRQ